MYNTINQLRLSPAFKLTQSQESRHTRVSMPHMPSIAHGQPLELKLCRNYYSYQFCKTTGPLQGFLKLITKVKVTIAPMGQ
eukprot:12088059-Karenia_brevis.AAC.1